MRGTAVVRPETLTEAAEDDRRTAAYRRAGLCDRDASHVSKGHAVGFTRLAVGPCAACAQTVATFPQATAHPLWRKWPRGRLSGPSVRSAAVRRVISCPDTATATTVVEEVRR